MIRCWFWRAAKPETARSLARMATIARFLAALEHVCHSLALQIVADGEGASRVIEIEVRGAPSDAAAVQVAHTIASSPLVKTMFAGADPNWGRILAAAGRAGVKFDPNRTDIWLCRNSDLPPRQPSIPSASATRTGACCAISVRWWWTWARGGAGRASGPATSPPITCISMPATEHKTTCRGIAVFT